MSIHVCLLLRVTVSSCGATMERPTGLSVSAGSTLTAPCTGSPPGDGQMLQKVLNPHLRSFVWEL